MTSTRRAVFCCLLLGQLLGCSFSPSHDVEQDSRGPRAAGDQQALSQNPYTLNRQAVPRRAQAGFDEAVLAMGKKQWGSAEAGLLRLVEEHPALSGPWLNLGIVYLATERPAEAETAFKQAISVNGSNLDAYNRLAALKRSGGEFAAAEALYQQALAVWPDHPDSHLNLGVLYDLYMGRFEDAAIHYQAYQVLQAEPDRRVAGWLADLNRRPQMLARTEQSQ